MGETNVHTVSGAHRRRQHGRMGTGNHSELRTHAGLAAHYTSGRAFAEGGACALLAQARVAPQRGWRSAAVSRGDEKRVVTSMRRDARGSRPALSLSRRRCHSRPQPAETDGPCPARGTLPRWRTTQRLAACISRRAWPSEAASAPLSPAADCSVHSSGPMFSAKLRPCCFRLSDEPSHGDQGCCRQDTQSVL